MSKLKFPLYSNSCGWNAMLPPRKPNQALDRSIQVDYAIIGAGYTGHAIARRLAELKPQAKIAIFEATTIGEGSSGRNSGFTGPDILPRAATVAGAQKAKEQSRLMHSAFNWMLDIIKENQIECNMRQVGSIRGAATELGEQSLKGVAEVARVNNIRHEVLNREQIAERIGSDYYRFGIHINDTYLLQPAALIRGLFDRLPDNVTLYENTPVSDISRQPNGWELQTAAGSVKAKSVAFANNGFVRKFGYLKLRMANIYTYAAVTKSVAEKDRLHLGQAAHWGLLPSHRLGTTLRRIGDDRLMVRSLYAHEAEVSPQEAQTKLRDRFERRWPSFKHVEFEYLWGGTTAFTMNGAPWWGQLNDGLFASGGCNGSGITKGTMLGIKLAELMCGVGDAAEVPKIMGLASRIAPEPFRSIGFHIISSFERKKAGLEA
jgi:glycine/D-amino acid oxidase-like deaminating enzyme